MKLKIVLPTAPTVAASAAASLALLGSALDADTRPAATLLDAVQSGFVHEWLGPAVALAAIAAVDRFALAPRARGAAVPPAPPGEKFPPPSRPGEAASAKGSGDALIQVC